MISNPPQIDALWFRKSVFGIAHIIFWQYCTFKCNFSIFLEMNQYFRNTLFDKQQKSALIFQFVGRLCKKSMLKKLFKNVTRQLNFWNQWSNMDCEAMTRLWLFSYLTKLLEGCLCFIAGAFATSFCVVQKMQGHLSALETMGFGSQVRYLDFQRVPLLTGDFQPAIPSSCAETCIERTLSFLG